MIKDIPMSALNFSESNSIDQKDGKTNFSGVAYSGKVIKSHWYWGDLIIDTSSINFKKVMPVLRDHKLDKIAGHGKLIINDDSSLSIDGEVSKITEHGKQITGLSKEGFPWQMSISVKPKVVVKLEVGASEKINGKMVKGPMTIFKDNSILETSFVALGADSNTSAVINNSKNGETIKLNLIRGNKMSLKLTENKEVMFNEKLIGRVTEVDGVESFTASQSEGKSIIEDVELKEKDAEISDLKKELSQLKLSNKRKEATEILKEKNLKLSEEQLELYLSMDDKQRELLLSLKSTVIKDDVNQELLKADDERNNDKPAEEATVELSSNEIALKVKALIEQKKIDGVTLNYEEALELI